MILSRLLPASKVLGYTIHAFKAIDSTIFSGGCAVNTFATCEKAIMSQSRSGYA